MKRRTFLVGLTVTLAGLAVGSKRLYTVLEEDKVIKYTLLDFFGLETIDKDIVIALEPLFDPSFEARAEEISMDDILLKLKETGIITFDGQLDQSQIKNLAKTDQIIAYNGKYYTSSELDVYTLAYLVWNES